jgi:hypothetical protein
MSDHASYRYSITIQSDDLALVNCLRSLSQFSQKTGNNRICWGGTKDKDWERAGHLVTFRFSRPEYREGFVKEIERLLPDRLWHEDSRSDSDPASPQS